MVNVNEDIYDACYSEIKDKVEIIDELKDQFYGMRDFYFKDLNGFRFGIGQPINTSAE